MDNLPCMDCTNCEICNATLYPDEDVICDACQDAYRKLLTLPTIAQQSHWREAA